MISKDEIEREFRLEVKSKKLAASGVHHKTGKRGYTGTIIFPSSLLRGKSSLYSKLFHNIANVIAYSLFIDKKQSSNFFCGFVLYQ